MSDEQELFNPKHSQPFIHLLTWGREFENMTQEDEEVYQQALSYIGLMYTNMSQGIDRPEASCRRLTALPSRLHPRFTQFVVQNQPRAIAMLAHVFACVKLLEDKTVWFRGVAGGQVLKMAQHLPPAWKKTVDWPMAVVEGRITLAAATT